MRWCDRKWSQINDKDDDSILSCHETDEDSLSSLDNSNRYTRKSKQIPKRKMYVPLPYYEDKIGGEELDWLQWTMVEDLESPEGLAPNSKTKIKK